MAYRRVTAFILQFQSKSPASSFQDNLLYSNACLSKALGYESNLLKVCLIFPIFPYFRLNSVLGKKTKGSSMNKKNTSQGKVTPDLEILAKNFIADYQKPMNTND